MAKSQVEKANSHERIVQAAALRFRERGVDGIGVADLMKEAELTHGGFYRHFNSRDDLVAEAVERALNDGGAAIASLLEHHDDPQGLFCAMVDGYLSTRHRDVRASSCAVTTLAADVARGDDRVRSTYTRQVEIYLEAIGSLMTGDDRQAKRAKAITVLSTLAGAVSLARAVNDDGISREILKSVASALKSQMIFESSR